MKDNKEKIENRGLALQPLVKKAGIKLTHSIYTHILYE